MSIPPFPQPASHRPSFSSGSTSSSSDDSEGDLVDARSRANTARFPRFSNMDGERRQGMVFSHSTPELVHRADGPPRGGQNENTGINDGGNVSGRSVHGAVASHLLAQAPQDTYDGQTWVDFLRASAPNTVHAANNPADPPSNSQNTNNRSLPPLPHERHTFSSSSASPYTAFPDFPARPNERESTSRAASETRKRRLTSAESPMRRPSGRGSEAPVSGISMQNPILLDPPGPSPTSRMPPPPSYDTSGFGGARLGMGMGLGRRESDIVLPQWQPDSDVSHCPVCGSQFTFFYRKHHCRKCGRVVCSACSPHRITIPRQFIVHPPHENPNIIDLTADHDDDEQNPLSSFGPFRNRLGGGEEVRVCNPCVPDPNYSPPPQYTASPSLFSSRSSQYPPPFSPTAAPPPPLPPSAGHSGAVNRITAPYSRHRGSQSLGHSNGSQAHLPHPQNPASRAHNDPFTDRRVSFHNSTRVSDLWPPTHPPLSGPLPPIPPSSTSSTMGRPPRGRPSWTLPEPTPPAPRQIPEEDECPICGRELPAMGAHGDDSARTAHVEACIAEHSSSPVPTSNAFTSSTSLPAQRTRGMSSAGGPAPSAEASSSNRLSLSARGMYTFAATEKDCVDGDGKEAECVICFEEFEAGDKMARLVCFCKFHEECIKKWWDTKGRGACPSHQVQL